MATPVSTGVANAFADRAALVGSAWTEVAKRSGRTEGDLALEACLLAIQDAGLTPEDIDGIATYPGGMVGSVSATYVLTGLGMQNVRWYCDADGHGPAAMTGLVEGVLAVAAGLCEHVVVFRSMVRPTTHGAGGIPTTIKVPADMAFKMPYGGVMASQWMAMYQQAHMHDYGTRPEHFGEIAISTREWASRNERAIQRTPITMDDYLASPFVSEPIRLLDSDYPVDAGIAVVITTPERARDLPHRPVLVRSMSIAPGPKPDWDQAPRLTEMSAAYAARDMWSRAGDLGVGDVDCAFLYDGFTFIALSWLEALGFCGVGEGGPFVEGGTLRAGGRLPTNTHGGNLSEGRTHGMGQIAEAVRQLQGRSGGRQVPDARVAVVTGGGGPIAGAVLLHSP
jgi:acetyl-CoA acetyltransferase